MAPASLQYCSLSEALYSAFVLPMKWFHIILSVERLLLWKWTKPTQMEQTKALFRASYSTKVSYHPGAQWRLRSRQKREGSFPSGNGRSRVCLKRGLLPRGAGDGWSTHDWVGERVWLYLVRPKLEVEAKIREAGSYWLLPFGTDC